MDEDERNIYTYDQWVLNAKRNIPYIIGVFITKILPSYVFSTGHHRTVLIYTICPPFFFKGVVILLIIYIIHMRLKHNTTFRRSRNSWEILICSRFIPTYACGPKLNIWVHEPLYHLHLHETYQSLSHVSKRRQSGQAYCVNAAQSWLSK